jgi:hypothetical protein
MNDKGQIESAANNKQNIIKNIIYEKKEHRFILAKIILLLNSSFG